MYGNPEAVDDELVDLIYGPSCDEGALEAFVSILTGPPGPRPDRLLTDVVAPELPLLVLWGDADPFTPADGPVGRFFQALPQQRQGTTFSFLPGERQGAWGLAASAKRQEAGVGRDECASTQQSTFPKPRIPALQLPCMYNRRGALPTCEWGRQQDLLRGVGWQGGRAALPAVAQPGRSTRCRALI